MAVDNSLLFGRVAVSLGYMTSEQVAECVKQQEKSISRSHLGTLALEKNFLTIQQLNHIIDVQKANLEESPSYSEQAKGNVIFGRVAVQKRFNRGFNINTALRRQVILEEKGIYKKLGELLVENGDLTSKQVGEILAYNGKEIAFCMHCNVQYNVLKDSEDTHVCMECGRDATFIVRPSELLVSTALDPDDNRIMPPNSDARRAYVEAMRKALSAPPVTGDDTEVITPLHDPESAHPFSQMGTARGRETGSDIRNWSYIAKKVVELGVSNRRELLESIRWHLASDTPRTVSDEPGNREPDSESK